MTGTTGPGPGRTRASRLGATCRTSLAGRRTRLSGPRPRLSLVECHVSLRSALNGAVPLPEACLWATRPSVLTGGLAARGKRPFRTPCALPWAWGAAGGPLPGRIGRRSGQAPDEPGPAAQDYTLVAPVHTAGVGAPPERRSVPPAPQPGTRIECDVRHRHCSVSVPGFRLRPRRRIAAGPATARRLRGWPDGCACGPARSGAACPRLETESAQERSVDNFELTPRAWGRRRGWA